MTAEQPAPTRDRSHAYEMFILVLTLLSLAIMVLLLLPLSDPTLQLLAVYDNVICVIFLIDFFLRLRRAETARQYLIGERGWLDLLGSIPAFGVFQLSALFRLARLSRLGRIARLLRGKQKRDMVDDVLAHRGQYAAFVTILGALLILVAASVLVLQFESKSAEASIVTGGDALWWSVVTLTTVGYGDFFPVTTGGRITAVFVMFMGVGIIGSLASILASVLVASPAEAAAEADEDRSSIQAELRAIRGEIAALRDQLGSERGDTRGGA